MLRIYFQLYFDSHERQQNINRTNDLVAYRTKVSIERTRWTNESIDGSRVQCFKIIVNKIQSPSKNNCETNILFKNVFLIFNEVIRKYTAIWRYYNECISRNTCELHLQFATIYNYNQFDVLLLRSFLHFKLFCSFLPWRGGRAKVMQKYFNVRKARMKMQKTNYSDAAVKVLLRLSLPFYLNNFFIKKQQK